MLSRRFFCEASLELLHLDHDRKTPCFDMGKPLLLKMSAEWSDFSSDLVRKWNLTIGYAISILSLDTSTLEIKLFLDLYWSASSASSDELIAVGCVTVGIIRISQFLSSLLIQNKVKSVPTSQGIIKGSSFGLASSIYGGASNGLLGCWRVGE